jgi:hypothetical protein
MHSALCGERSITLNYIVFLTTDELSADPWAYFINAAFFLGFVTKRTGKVKEWGKHRNLVLYGFDVMFADISADGPNLIRFHRQNITAASTASRAAPVHREISHD